MAINVRVGDKLLVFIDVYFPCYMNNDKYEGDIMMHIEFIKKVFLNYAKQILIVHLS